MVVRKIIPFAIAFFALSFQSCDKEPTKKPVDNSEKLFSVEFEPHVGENDLPPLGVNDFMSKFGGESFTVNNWAMLLSDFSLITESNDTVILGDGYQWVNFRANRTSFDYQDIPTGSYKGIYFRLGLDSNINHGDPTIWPSDHPLNPNLTGLHWGWSGGYIFHAFEGMYKANDSAASSGFSFHTATMEFVSEYFLPLNFEVGSNSLKAVVTADAQQFFENPNGILLKEKAVSHSAGESEKILMNGLLSNAQSVFVLKIVE